MECPFLINMAPLDGIHYSGVVHSGLLAAVNPLFLMTKRLSGF